MMDHAWIDGDMLQFDVKFQRCEVLDSLKALFAAPLSPSKIEAFQVLFAPGFDPVAMELNLSGFEDDALYPFSR